MSVTPRQVVRSDQTFSRFNEAQLAAVLGQVPMPSFCALNAGGKSEAWNRAAAALAVRAAVLTAVVVGAVTAVVVAVVTAVDVGGAVTADVGVAPTVDGD